MSQQDIEYMRLAIEEARKGRGRTSPNPSVGAIIVKDGKIVGRGYHKKAGTPHAEVNAIADAGEHTADATIYVTLEPCNHTGRTPPCTKAIQDAGITRVVVGMMDPNPSVEGGGCTYLQTQGVEVESGLLDEDCHALNRPFVKHITTGMPWVVMKAGMSLDARISYTKGKGGRITGKESRQYTHELRNIQDAILIGVDTALIDDPSLTTRLSYTDDCRDPLRIILDSTLRFSPEAAMLNQETNAETWIYCGPNASGEQREKLIGAGAKVIRVGVSQTGRLDVQEVLKHLGAQGITSVLVEGGATIHGCFIDQGLIDEVYLFMASIFIGEQGTPLISGYSALDWNSCFQLRQMECKMLGEDLMIHGYFF